MDVLFDVYDSVGDAAVGGSDATIVFDSIRHLHESATLASGEISVILPTYMVTPPLYTTVLLFARTSIYVSSGTSRSQSKSWVEIDTGSGYEAVAGTDSFGYNRTLGSGYSTIPICATVHIDKTVVTPVKFRIRANRIEGSSNLSTVAGGSTFTGIIDL